ncbi:hypothetical protein C0J50_0724 [Silurus asotus]|uniref:Uncharacterized protein n=1 Tax=Silurus asotus TaxID=30991 RepID=A0AAD5FCT2_SILAS|nr:hypothetical protein C0J50_0724 [Silurus asotus]
MMCRFSPESFPVLSVSRDTTSASGVMMKLRENPQHVDKFVDLCDVKSPDGALMISSHHLVAERMESLDFVTIANHTASRHGESERNEEAVTRDQEKKKKNEKQKGAM